MEPSSGLHFSHLYTPVLVLFGGALPINLKVNRYWKLGGKDVPEEMIGKLVSSVREDFLCELHAPVDYYSDLEVMIGTAHGGKVECRHELSDTDWYPTRTPDWENPECEFRLAKTKVQRFWLQENISFPEGAPQREEYLDDSSFEKACFNYEKGWRARYECGDPNCKNFDCPEHPPERFTSSPSQDSSQKSLDHSSRMILQERSKGLQPQGVRTGRVSSRISGIVDPG